MNNQSYMIDTNIIIGLEDNHTVHPHYADFERLTKKHKVNVFIHDAAYDDIHRDRDLERRKISLSKLRKFQSIEKVANIQKADLESEFGKINNPNDEVDVTLLHALSIGVVNFLVTEDQDIHSRARQHSMDLENRVLFIADAIELLTATFEPNDAFIRHVAEVSAHTISLEDTFFDSLRNDYEGFNTWWETKCIAARRQCWVVHADGKLAGIIVRKDETRDDTDATQKLPKILKICTFKVSPENRGVKLGELLLKKVMWYAQENNYDLAYLTAYQKQDQLIALLEFYGFEKTQAMPSGELIFERRFSNNCLTCSNEQGIYDINRTNYPRFVTGPNVCGFIIPIREVYHDILFPDLRNAEQMDMFLDSGPKRPGNTIRKVYICRSPSSQYKVGSILFFYKSKSKEPPSQSLTAIGILENVFHATSPEELTTLTGGRSVYSEADIKRFNASPDNPCKVINFLLVKYIDPPISINELTDSSILKSYPQAITKLKSEKLHEILKHCNLAFQI